MTRRDHGCGNPSSWAGFRASTLGGINPGVTVMNRFGRGVEDGPWPPPRARSSLPDALAKAARAAAAKASVSTYLRFRRGCPSRVTWKNMRPSSVKAVAPDEVNAVGGPGPATPSRFSTVVVQGGEEPGEPALLPHPLVRHRSPCRPGPGRRGSRPASRSTEWRIQKGRVSSSRASR